MCIRDSAYTTLYKLLGEDQSLEEYCRQLERSTNNKMVGVILFIGLIAMLLLGYYILYIRKRLVNRWNLEQVLEINRQIFAASLIQVPETEEALQREEDTLKAIPQRIVDEGFDAVNELLSIDRLGIAVYNETTHQLEYASNSIENELSSAGDNGTSTAEDELWKEGVQRLSLIHISEPTRP